MANKFVVNACSMSNKAIPTDSSLNYWKDPVTKTTRVFCPSCAAFVSINRVAGTFRKHSAHSVAVEFDQRDLIQSFE
jgi:hypothetical protein